MRVHLGGQSSNILGDLFDKYAARPTMFGFESADSESYFAYRPFVVRFPIRKGSMLRFMTGRT